MTLDALRNDLRALLHDALPDLAGDRDPLQAERIASLVALPAFEVEGAHEAIVDELEQRGGAEAGDLLFAMSWLHPEPLRSAAAAAAERLGGERSAPELELGRVLRVEGDELSLLAAELHADGGSFALTVLSEEGSLSGGLGQPASAEEVAEALDELEDAEVLHPSVAAAALRSTLAEAARVGVGADEGLTLDGALVVAAFGLPPEAWPDLPLLAEPEPDFEPAPEPVRAVPPRPPADAARKKAKRRSQKAARRKNR